MATTPKDSASKRPRIDPDDFDLEIYHEESAAATASATSSIAESFRADGFVFNTDVVDAESEAELVDSPRHAVLFERATDEQKAKNISPTSGKGNARPLQTPVSQEEWESGRFVKLPFYEHNRDPESGKCLWNLIKRSLTELAETLSADFDYIHVEYAIIKYNRKYKNKWNFSVLHQLFDQVAEQGQEDHLTKLLQKMIRLALDMPAKFPKPVPVLKAGQTFSVSLTQEQCACVLANAFFCTFPGRLGSENPDELPFINFNSILSDSGHRRNQVKIEKLVCLFHYFNRVLTKMPDGVVTFSRLTLDPEDTPEFESSTATFKKVRLMLDGTIEDCTGALQLDFANKYLGGGVLNSGCVQEEIRFLICPELIVSLLFTERLLDNESVVMKGCERYSSYTGYSRTFKWAGDYVDSTKRDKWNRLCTHVLAIDALEFYRSHSQFQEEKIKREIVKCYSGLKKTLEGVKAPDGSHPAVATGNWGCGAFNGDKQLKFLVQLMAAAEANRDVIYYTFNDTETFDDLTEILAMIRTKNLNVSQLYGLLIDYTLYVEALKGKKASSKSSSGGSSESPSPDKASRTIRPIRDFLRAKLKIAPVSAPS